MPKKKPNLSVEVRAKIVTLVEEGYSMNQVAKRMKVSRCCVQELVKKHKETGTVQDRSREGRPRMTTKREDRLLARMSIRDRRKTAPELRSDWLEDAAVDASVSTVRRRLHEVGLRGCVAVKKPLLTQRHKDNRLTWAREHRDWSADDWGRVIWSDESTFQLWRTKGRVWIRRRPAELYMEECIWLLL